MLFLTGPLYMYYGFSFGFVCVCTKGLSACENVFVSASVCVSWAFFGSFFSDYWFVFLFQFVAFILFNFILLLFHDHRGLFII